MGENERAAALTAINEMERWVERKYGRYNEFVKLTEAARAALTPEPPHVFGKVCPHGIPYDYNGSGCGKGCTPPKEKP